jgi:hypothetical protein
MKLKDSLVVYLPQRIIIFPLHLYINTLVTKVLNSLYDWDIGKTKKFSGKETIFNFFLEKEILNIFQEIKIVYKDLNLKVYTVYREASLTEENLNYLKPENFVCNSAIKKFKKICGKYFIKNLPNNLKFNSSKKSYKNILCGDPTGEELEFLTKISSD